MNIIKFSIASMMLATGVVSVNAESQMVRLDTPPAGSGIEQTYDEATNTYSLYVRENNFNDVLPTIAFVPLEAPLPADLRTIAFEYMSDTPVGWEILRLEKIFTGKLNREFELYFSVEPSDKWQTMRIPVGSYRDLNTIRFGSKEGQIVKWTWRDLMGGATLKMRNIRYESEELPFKNINVTTGTTTVEAEDYLSSSTNSGFSSRQIDLTLQEYHHPVNEGEIPIMAWLGYSVISGSKQDLERVKQGFEWMAEAGFNLSPGLNFGGCNLAALYDGLEVNGNYIDLLPDNVNLKLLCDPGSVSSDIANWVPQYKDSPRLAGYYLRDEPWMKDLDAMSNKANLIRDIDNNHFLYSNLFSMSATAPEYGAESWDHYVHTFFKKTRSSFLSWDMYPVREATDGTIFLRDDYYANLEASNRICQYYGVPFWAFVHACSNTPAPATATNMNPSGCPVPTEEDMRLQAFSNLAYGAQGIQYYPYVTPAPWAENMGYDNGPIDYATGERTATWYYCKNINREIQALSWVFLGAQLTAAGHTNAETPLGCRRLTSDMLPDEIASVSSDGSGVCATVLQNGTNKFLMVVNTDVNNAQTVTVTKNSVVKRVLADGTTSSESVGSLVEKLPVGGYILLLVNENAEPFVRYSKAGQRDVNITDYRPDAENIIIAASDVASNGHYLYNMGSESWENYSRYMPEEKRCFITRDEAVANWGSTFSYIIDVPEDIDVNISVAHSVPWNAYGPVAAVGARPGFSYIIEDEPDLNWPKQYAASMTLAIDGEVITPANQAARPVAPDVYDPDGAEFNRILADKSLWTPTAVDGKPSDVLYFWPKAGGDNSLTLQCNERPDYVAVHLSAGQHKITVNSLSAPWHFDSLIITDTNTSGIDNVNDGIAGRSLNAIGVNGGILIDVDGTFTVYNLSGVTVANGVGTSMVELPAGLYIVKAGNFSTKVLSK